MSRDNWELLGYGLLLGFVGAVLYVAWHWNGAH